MTDQGGTGDGSAFSVSGALETIGYADFERVDIRVGTIVEVLPFPEARRPAFKLVVDFGPAIGRRRSSAQVTVHYTADQLLGRQVAAVVNFPRKQIGKFMSEVLVLGFPDADGAVVLIGPSLPVPDGQAVLDRDPRQSRRSGSDGQGATPQLSRPGD